MWARGSLAGDRGRRPRQEGPDGAQDGDAARRAPASARRARRTSRGLPGLPRRGSLWGPGWARGPGGRRARAPRGPRGDMEMPSREESSSSWSTGSQSSCPPPTAAAPGGSRERSTGGGFDDERAAAPRPLQGRRGQRLGLHQEVHPLVGCWGDVGRWRRAPGGGGLRTGAAAGARRRARPSPALLARWRGSTDWGSTKASCAQRQGRLRVLRVKGAGPPGRAGKRLQGSPRASSGARRRPRQREMSGPSAADTSDSSGSAPSPPPRGLTPWGPPSERPRLVLQKRTVPLADSAAPAPPAAAGRQRRRRGSCGLRERRAPARVRPLRRGAKAPGAGAEGEGCEGGAWSAPPAVAAPPAAAAPAQADKEPLGQRGPRPSLSPTPLALPSPGEVLLEEKGVDWRKADAELERKLVISAR